MRLVDSRRLRGPNLQTRGPAAVAEVMLDSDDPGEALARIEAAWRNALDRLGSALGWAGLGPAAVVRPFAGGLCLALPSPPVPLDGLYAATCVNEWAIAVAFAAAASPGGGSGPHTLETFEAARERIAALIAADARPALVALAWAAHRRGVPFIWDDERVTLGMAGRSRTWPIDELPSPDQIDWGGLGRIPVALVTGTNGKTTSARLLARIARAAGFRAGHTSTDGVVVGDTVVEAGDFTGGEGARRLLRHPEVELAVLETARGGILRRGLTIDRAEVALITNVSPDHLGEFGVFDLATMARVKAVVGTVVPPEGKVVLNADDPSLLERAADFVAAVVLCSLDPAHPDLAKGRAQGGEVAFLRDRALWLARGESETRLVGVDEVPIAFGGAARYNLANALGAAASARALGLPLEAIARGLRSFSATDNPGRGQLARLPDGVRCLTDFGHNSAGLRSLFELCAGLRSEVLGRDALTLVFTAAGDRTDELLGGEAREIAAARPRRVILWETASLRRGRAEGEVTRVLRGALIAHGLGAGAIETAAGEVEAVDLALEHALPGELILVTPNIDRPAVAARLLRAGASAQAGATG